MLRGTSTTWRGVGNEDTIERKRNQGMLKCQTYEWSSHFGSGSSSPCCPGWHHIYQSWADLGKTSLNFWFIKPWAKEKYWFKSLSFGVVFHTARDDWSNFRLFVVLYNREVNNRHCSASCCFSVSRMDHNKSDHLSPISIFSAQVPRSSRVILFTIGKKIIPR